jgi:NAD(P)-dependent dehydrogenase (short-subunit alcohol dehydrogenase family)
MNKKNILVTGANRGIGLELCKLLAPHKNFKVILTSRNEKGRIITEELIKLGYDIHYSNLDVSDFASLKVVIADIVNKIGKIDILVNNAGIYVDSKDLDEFPSFLELTEKILAQTLDTNTFGVIYLIQLIRQYMADDGLIINLSSGGGKINTSGDRSGHVAYRLSKSAINSFTKSISQKKFRINIKIISICPGWVRSDMGGPNAPRSKLEGATDILKVILNHSSIENGSFSYNSEKQLL